MRYNIVKSFNVKTEDKRITTEKRLTNRVDSSVYNAQYTVEVFVRNAQLIIDTNVKTKNITVTKFFYQTHHCRM